MRKGIPRKRDYTVKGQLFFFFFYKFIYLFICLHWVFIAVRGLLIAVASLVVEHGLPAHGLQ